MILLVAKGHFWVEFPVGSLLPSLPFPLSNFQYKTFKHKGKWKESFLWLNQFDESYRQLICLLRNLYAGQEETVRTGHGITDWFQIGKGVRQGCILSPSYLTYIQSTSCEMPGWMKYKLESRSLGEISITSDTQMTPPLCGERKQRRTKEPLDESERGELSWFKTQHSEN